MIQPAGSCVGPRQRALAALMVLAGLLAPFGGCDRGAPDAAKTAAARPVGAKTAASLSPAAVDLIVGMGLTGRLAGVSSFQPRDPATDALPRVGDYRSIDWEQLSRVRPDVLVVQYAPGKVPEGLMARAAELGIAVERLEFDTLEQIESAARQIAQALTEPASGEALVGRLRSELEAVRKSVSGRPAVRTLLVIGDPTALVAAGPGTFLSELLETAGGTNVLVQATASAYPSLDRERLAALDPEAVIELAPGDTPQARERSAAFWNALPGLRAVHGGRVYRITDDDILLPGANVARTARRFAAVLHGATTREAGR